MNREQLNVHSFLRIFKFALSIIFVIKNTLSYDILINLRILLHDDKAWWNLSGTGTAYVEFHSVAALSAR